MDAGTLQARRGATGRGQRELTMNTLKMRDTGIAETRLSGERESISEALSRYESFERRSECL